MVCRFSTTWNGNEIIQGRADGSFGANERISREEMAVMLNRALKVVQREDATNSVQGNMVFVDNAEIVGIRQRSCSLDATTWTVKWHA